MKGFILTLLYIISKIVFIVSLKQNEIEIKIFYDPFSPESIYFFDNNFQNFFENKDLYNKFIINLIPGATMTYNPNRVVPYQCDKGINECRANRIHSCALYLFEMDIAYKYILCHFKNIRNYDYNNEETLNFCSNKINFNKDVIKKCLETSVGKSLMMKLYNRKKLLKTPINHNPYIMMNNNYDMSTEKKFLDNFSSYCCNLLNYKILSCEKYS